MDVIKLLKELTLREKLGQMTQFDAGFVEQTGNESFTGPLHEMDLIPKDLISCGTVLNCTTAERAVRLQKKHLEYDPHKIPLIFMFDVIHGYKTVFPIPLAMACTFDPETAREYGRISAKEARASGVRVSFAPMIDLSRDARWGRVLESAGEDPYLAGLFGKAYVEDLQGDKGLDDKESLACCVKHFAGYGAVEAGREYNTVSMDDYTLREFYLRPYREAIEAGSACVMPSFNTMNGIPSAASKRLLRSILRDEIGFVGVTVSDWGAIHEISVHGACEGDEGAAKLGIEAGCDIEMMSQAYIKYGEKLVSEGKLDEKLIDEAVLRILTLKDKLGLFDDPYAGISEAKEKELFLSESSRKASRTAAARSFVLLKNEGDILPLSKDKKIAVIGPYAESQMLTGLWNGIGSTNDVVSVREAFESRQISAEFLKGCDFEDPKDIDIEGALKLAERSDMVVMPIGEKIFMSGECGSRAFIDIPEVQLRLVEEVKKAEKPIIATVVCGRPLDLRKLSELADAIVVIWFPGTEAGNAICDLLYGDALPEGRLAMSFPYCVGQCPVYYNGFNTGRPNLNAGGYVSKYLDAPNEPLYPFGYGLGYSKVEYSDIRLSSNEMSGSIKISATVGNVGKHPTIETAQLYVRDLAGSVVRPVKELKGICKLRLEPGESKTAEFILTEKDIAFYHPDGCFYAEEGEFEVFVGANSSDSSLKAKFILKK